MVQILDTTLREGEQAFGVRFTLEQKVELAQLLDKAGVDYIEAGMPIISDYDRKSVKAVANLGLRAEVLGHARAKIKDIDAVVESNCEWVGIFCGVNDLSLKHKLNGKTKQEAFSMIGDSIEYSKNKGLKVRYTIEDATRTNIKDLVSIARVAGDSGADRICIADSVGCATPEKIQNLVYELKNGLPLEVHCHNDYGLALANSLTAYEAGAEVISASVNGIGERAGITSLQEFMLALRNLYKDEVNIRNLKFITQVSRKVEEITGINLDALRPITGENAFTHIAELHRKAVISCPQTYEHLTPSSVGRERTIALPNILVPKKIPATELPYHKKNAPGNRFVFVDNRFFPDSKFYVIGRRVERVSKVQQPYVDPHIHNCESCFVFIGDEENLEGLCANVEINGKEFKVDSPSLVIIPLGVSHAYKLTDGRGWFFNLVRKSNYQDSLAERTESQVLAQDSLSLLIRKAQKQDKCLRKGERPITSNLSFIENPIRYIFDTVDSGLYIALHDINQDSPFAYKMVSHHHETDEMYALFSRAGEQLTINLESNGQSQIVNSPALVYHKKGDVHKYSPISGSGKILIVLETRKAGEGYHFKRARQ
ncbi:MAG: 2-isopropylmalate synthase [Nanoarchaeota archaeon]|nr:2-isopropylmalate synthase [Nanoarchaeota archaeon]